MKIYAKGIDVSNAGQGYIADWSKVAKNTDFAILKVGNAYNTEAYYIDKQFNRNADECEKYGIPYGVYVYQYFTSVAKAIEAGKETVKALNGRKLSMPVFLDIEEQRVFNLGKAKILEMAKAFCNEIEKAGYEYGTYCSTSWYNAYLTDAWYDTKIKWLAQYNTSVTYKGKYDIWQYTAKGRIDGINDDVDMNYCYYPIKGLKGDVNLDDKVTPSDARTILRASIGLEKLEGQAELNADVNSDGKITASDSREALRITTGLADEPTESEYPTFEGVKQFSKKVDGETYLSPHFQVWEFACKDGTDKILINAELIKVLERLFDKLDCKAINITSGYRTPSHSVKVGGYRTDQHTKGNAVDITCKKQDGSLYSSNQICLALEDLNHMGGIGRINKTHSVHVDVRGKKCWFDEVNGEKTTNSWYSYFGIKR